MEGDVDFGLPLHLTVQVTVLQSESKGMFWFGIQIFVVLRASEKNHFSLVFILFSSEGRWVFLDLRGREQRIKYDPVFLVPWKVNIFGNIFC